MPDSKSDFVVFVHVKNYYMYLFQVSLQMLLFSFGLLQESPIFCDTIHITGVEVSQSQEDTE